MPRGPARQASVGSSGLGGHVGGYDAVTSGKGKRATPLGRVLSEDQELRALPRRQLITGARDLNRNFAICAWMCEQHCDYVSSFHFRSKTGIKELDTKINDLMRWWTRKENCDHSARFSLPELVRMWELRRVIDGDVLINRLADGRIQTIENDRIQSFGGVDFAGLGIQDPAAEVINGVWINPDNGRARGYLVFKRRPNWDSGLVWDRCVSAKFADLLGYFKRYDQVRGISPLSSAVNTLRDTYEGFDYALLKAKISQFFAMMITRKASEDIDALNGGPADPSEGDEHNPNGEDPNKPRYDLDMNHRGGIVLDMDPGDEAKVIESAQPSNQFQSFTQIMVMVALKALGIPFSFFDESHTNYSGMRSAGQNYEKSCHHKREPLRRQLDKNTAWRLGLFIADGHLKLPTGWTIRNLRWSWDHTGVPWYDPSKEVTGAVAAINAGLSSPQKECKMLGRDFYENVDEIAEAQEYARGKGVTLSTALPAVALDDPNNSKTKTEVENEVDADEGGAPGGKRSEFWD